MPADRKPLHRWEALPWLIFAAILVAGIGAGAIPDPRLHATAFVVLTVAAVAAVIWAFVAFRRRGNPDGDGTLTSLAGIELAVAPPVGGHGTPVTVTSRTALTAALAWQEGELIAVLVPRATRWLHRRHRIAVHLVARGRAYRVGLLPEQADPALASALGPLRDRGWFVAVPARIEQLRGRTGVVVALQAAAETAATASLAAGAGPR